MIIETVDALDFRNFEKVGVRFCDGTNIIIGKNTVGKTNLLEACFYSLRARSFRNISDRYLIRFGKEESFIRSVVRYDGGEETIEIYLNKERKKIFINEERLEKISELQKNYPIIVFTPDDMKILKESKSMRRDLMDEMICGVDKIYAQALKMYTKMIEQRNRLLKGNTHHRYFRDQLQATDQAIAKQAAVIIKKRFRYVKKINDLVGQISFELSAKKETVEVRYQSYLENASMEEVEKNYLQLMETHLSRDMERLYTTVGCHREDLQVFIDGKNTKYFASQGQIRTAILSIKLAQLDILRYYTDEKPLLLLDDVLSELDDQRIAYLLRSIRGVQSFITTTDFEQTNKVDEKHIIELEKFFI